MCAAAREPEDGPGVGAVLLVAAVLAYGSLYPFHFIWPPTADAWQRLLTLRAEDLRTANTLANVLLFLPLGLLAAAHGRTRRGWDHGTAVAIAAVTGFALAIALQLGQTLVPARVPSAWDVASNTVGTLAGAALPRARLARLARRVRPASAFAAAIVALWIAAEAFSFVPAPGREALLATARALPDQSLLRPGAALTGLIGWATVAYLWRTRARLRWPRAGPITLLATVAVAQFVVFQRVPDLAALAGGAAGLALADVAGHRAAAPRVLLAGVVAWLVLAGLQPFEPRPLPATFHWLPLAGFLDGHPLFGAQVALEKLFWYGALLELALAAGLRRSVAIGAGVALLAAIEWGQRWVTGGHVAEITDPFLFAGLALARAWLVRGAARDRPRRAPGRQPPPRS